MVCLPEWLLASTPYAMKKLRAINLLLYYMETDLAGILINDERNNDNYKHNTNN